VTLTLITKCSIVNSKVAIEKFAKETLFLNLNMEILHLAIIDYNL